MSMHCVAFSESQDLGGVQGNVAGVADPSVRVNGDDIVVPAECNKIFGALAAAGASATRAVLVAPSLRRLNPYEIDPIVLALFPTTLPSMSLHPGSSQQLDTSESLNAQLISNPAAAEQASVAVFLCDAPPTKVEGKIIHARFTTNVALVAGTWVNSAIAFIDDLPSGVYSCVGASIVVATAVVARFYPVGGKWRPGFPCGQTRAAIFDPAFRNGGLGKWFDFEQTQPPTIDILSSAAAGAADYVGVMDLIPA